jgi:hypothetical protein
MFFAEMNGMSWFRGAFLQVPNLEIFILINHEEFTDTSCKVRTFHGARCGSNPITLLLSIVIKIEHTPSYLSNGRSTFLKPHSNWSSECFVIHAKIYK